MTGISNDMDPALAAAVELVIFDVDGVLTDAGVYVGATEQGEPVELKRFDIQDGLGVKMLMWAGIHVAFVSGRESGATLARARELGVEECHHGPGGFKLPLVEGILHRKKVGWDEVAIVADDLADLPVFRKAGLSVAVANAVPEVAAEATWRTRATGGRGAVREFARTLLTARGQWSEIVEGYCRERSG